MNIIPAIDIIDGKCVRLKQGDYNNKTVYSNNPLDVAKQFEDNGLQYLHLVDLDGAKYGSVINVSVLERIARETNLIIDFSGGIRSSTDLKRVFDSGAAKVTVGSIALSRQEIVLEWLEEYGGDSIIISADSMNKQIAVNGWLENSGIDIVPFIQQYKKLGATTVMCTDIAKDGMLAGPSLTLYEEIIAAADINLIASGGISTMADIRNLNMVGCKGAIIGKAIYEGYIKLSELTSYVEEENNTLS